MYSRGFTKVMSPLKLSKSFGVLFRVRVRMHDCHSFSKKASPPPRLRPLLLVSDYFPSSAKMAANIVNFTYASMMFPQSN